MRRASANRVLLLTPDAPIIESLRVLVARPSCDVADVNRYTDSKAEWIMILSDRIGGMYNAAVSLPVRATFSSV